MSQPTGNDVLMSSGQAPKSADWPSDGWAVEGEVLGNPKSYHCREYDKENPGGGKLKFFPSGDPVLGLHVDLKTSQRELGNPEDVGIRRAYIDKARMLTAVRDAVRAVGAAGIEAGGYLTIVRTGTEDGQGTIPALTWAARYSPPGQWTQPVAVPDVPPDWAQRPTQQPLTGMPAVAQQHAAQAAQTGAAVTSTAPSSRPTITGRAAAALANAGIDVTAYNIVPE